MMTIRRPFQFRAGGRQTDFRREGRKRLLRSALSLSGQMWPRPRGKGIRRSKLLRAGSFLSDGMATLCSVGLSRRLTWSACADVKLGGRLG